MSKSADVTIYLLVKGRGLVSKNNQQNRTATLAALFYESKDRFAEQILYNKRQQNRHFGGSVL